MGYQILTDIHTHTLFSRHAYSTIGENVAAARAAGLELLGSADHFSAMLFPDQDVHNFQFFYNQGVWPRDWDGVTVLRAAEADIVSLDGALFGQDIACPLNIVGRSNRRERSLFDQVTEGLDYVVASVHNSTIAAEASLAQATEMYVAALHNPRVLMLGHPGRSGVAFDLDEVLGAAKALGKLIEINNHSLAVGSRHHRACRAIAERCAELGVGIAVSSDAHLARDIGRYEAATSLLEEIHFPVELIMNRDRATMLGVLAASGVCEVTW